MDRERFTSLINSFEEEYPVNKWVKNNVELWPLIKMRLFFGFHINNSKTPTSEKFTERLIKIFKGIWQFICLFYPFNKSIRVKDIYCLAPHFRYNSETVIKNRYFNDLIDDVQKCNLDFRLLEYGNTSKEYRNRIDHSKKTIFIENLKYAVLFLREILWKLRSRKNPDWPDYDKFIEEVNRNFKGAKIEQDHILKQFMYISLLKHIYILKFKKFEVENVYLLCYYVSEMYAMNLACNALGIPTWDIQHGGQGSQHMAYTNFNKIPDKGYDLLPKNFWCWDEDSAREINKWAKNQSFHKVYVKGNPWINFCLKNYAISEAVSEKIILYTMQPIDGIILEDYLLNAIKNTKLGYKWYLRLHPRQLDQKRLLISVLKDHDLLSKVEIEKATFYPLPALLSQCHIHISKYSGSILEAYSIGVKSIIIDPLGRESFPSVAKSDIATCVLNRDHESLLNQIYYF
ncbi:hypothetical protein [Christiangramia aquimixticola]|uniref:hypothetical protein n=1 Tax=Christiangramia aquimixticola TaxID=1697558 RepID=UPI003AA84EF0